MTTSALGFRGESLYVEDRELRELLKAVAYHLQDYATHDSATANPRRTLGLLTLRGRRFAARASGRGDERIARCC